MNKNNWKYLGSTLFATQLAINLIIMSQKEVLHEYFVTTANWTWKWNLLEAVFKPAVWVCSQKSRLNGKYRSWMDYDTNLPWTTSTCIVFLLVNLDKRLASKIFLWLLKLLWLTIITCEHCTNIVLIFVLIYTKGININ